MVYHMDTLLSREVASHIDTEVLLSPTTPQSSPLEHCLSSPLSSTAFIPAVMPSAAPLMPPGFCPFLAVYLDHALIHWMQTMFLSSVIQTAGLHCCHTSVIGARGVSAVDQYTAGVSGTHSSGPCASGTSCASYQYVSDASNYDYLTSDATTPC